MNNLDSIQNNTTPSITSNLMLSGYTHTSVGENIYISDTISLEKPVVQEVIPETVFGVHSTLSKANYLDDTAEMPLISNAIFQITVLTFFILFIIFIHQNINDISLTFRNIILNKNDKKGAFSNNIKSKYNRFALAIQCIGVILMSIIGVKILNITISDAAIDTLPKNIIISIAPIIMGLYILLALFQYLILRVIGTITMTNLFVDTLISLKMTAFAIITIVAAPITIMYALCPPNEGVVWGYILMLIVILSLIWFLIRTIELFISKKISILQWFLYLCCVEIFPLSLIVAYIVKY